MVKEKTCMSCFYGEHAMDAFPCNVCKQYNYYLHEDVYKDNANNKAWDKVIDGLNGLSDEDFILSSLRESLTTSNKSNYDTVNKPKHYMLFEEEGIEVRDVIEKLIEKMTSENTPGTTMFESDYVQLMQYLMRFMDKNGVEDLKKARWYLDKLIQSYHDVEAY